MLPAVQGVTRRSAPVGSLRVQRIVLAAGAAVTLACAGGVHAQTLSWNNAAGGSAGTAANWNPAQVPAAANPLLFGLNAVYPVTFNATTPQSASMSFTRGTVTLTMSAAHSTGALNLGNGNATNGIVNLTTGTWNTSTVQLGPAFGSAGTLNVNDDDALLDCGRLDVAADTNLVCNLSVTGSGTINSASVTIGGQNPLGTGNVTVSGQTQIVPARRSTLAVTGSITVGEHGIGNLTVSNGGLVSCTGSMIVAEEVFTPGPIFSEGNVTVGGQGLLLPATINIDGVLRIGRDTLLGGDTGNGSMVINDDGLVTVDGATQVGGSGLGSGVLTVNPGARLITTGLTIGASGDFAHTGGRVQVNGGSFIPESTALLRVSGAADTELILDGIVNTPAFTAASNAVNALLIGDGGAGVLTLRGGADVAVLVGDVSLGNGLGSSGTLNVEGGATLEAQDDAAPGPSGEMFIGDEGIGAMNIRSGGAVSCTNLFIGGVPAAGDGAVLVDGAGTSLACSGIAIGFLGAGSGALTISNGAIVTTDGPFSSQVTIDSAGSLTIDGGTLDATTDIRNDGAFSMTNGTVRAERFIFTQPFSASGTIDAKLVGSVDLITASGDLILGDDSTTAHQGTDLAVGAFRVELRDSDVAQLGDVSINGGLLTTVDRLILGTNSSLSGTGTVSGVITNHSSITATGTNGLTFLSTVINPGDVMGGTKFTFGGGGAGGFIGHGVIASKIVGAPGSRFLIDAPTTFGDGSTAGFVTGGELDIVGELTLHDSNGVGLGSLTTLRSTTLVCLSGIVIDSVSSLDVFRGGGQVHGNFTNLGLLAPGILDGDTTQQLDIVGTYSMISGNGRGRLDVEIGGPLLVDHDRVVAAGCVLAGTLNVSLINGLVPKPGFVVPVVSVVERTGEFETVNLPAGFRIRYTDDGVEVVFCPADFNGDGTLNSQDFFDFLGEFFGNTPDADFNADTAVNSQDFFDFLTAFFTGC